MSYTIASDIHTHTLYTRHAYSTLAENVAAARAAGLEVLGSADHFSCMIYPGHDLRNYQFFLNQSIWPRIWDGVTLLRGAEADIVGLHGELFGQDVDANLTIVGYPYRDEKTLFERVTEGLDYVVASVHDSSFTRDASLVQTTEMYLGALEHPKVLVLGHTGRSGVPFDMDEVLLRAKELGKLIELNDHSLEVDARGKYHGACSAIAQRCAELGVQVSVSSDAHLAMYIGRYPHIEQMLEEIHFPEELIANRSRASLLEAMAAAGVCDLRNLMNEEA